MNLRVARMGTEHGFAKTLHLDFFPQFVQSVIGEAYTSPFLCYPHSL